MSRFDGETNITGKTKMNSTHPTHHTHKPLTVGHIFAGAGGGILASEILGHDSIIAVENNPYRCEVLRARAAEGWFPNLHIAECDIRSFDPTPWTGKLDCIAAGFPCQDISAAGGGEGINGEKSGLVWELLRAVDGIRPGILFLENSPLIRTRGRIPIISWLVAHGYSWRDGTLAASHVGAGHIRNRWWCLAANGDGLRKLEQERVKRDERGWYWDGIKDAANPDRLRRKRRTRNDQQTQGRCESEDGNNAPPHSFEERLSLAVQQGRLSKTDAAAIKAVAGHCGIYNWNSFNPSLLRVVDGMAPKSHRIAACGDGQVPLQVATAWMLLSQTP